MSVDIENNSQSIDDFKLRKLRELYISELEECPQKYDPRDLKIVKENNDCFPCELFLESSNWSVDCALEAMVRHSKWRKENGVLDLKATDLPREVHQMRLFNPYGKDKNGHPTFFIQLSVPPGPKEFHPTVVRHFLWSCETVRSEVLRTGRKVAIVFDCRSAAVDIGVLRHVLDIFTTKYPPTAEYLAFLDMNFAFKMVLQVIKYFFPKYMWKRMIFINQEQLHEMIEESSLPTFLDGKSTGLSRDVLEKCPTLEDYGRQNGLSEKSIAKLKSYFQSKLVD